MTNKILVWYFVKEKKNSRQAIRLQKTEKHNRLNIKNPQWTQKKENSCNLLQNQKIDSNKTFKQLENKGTQGQMVEFVREVISDS